MMPESFEYAKNGGRKYLFHNLGDGSFEEVSRKARYRHATLGAWPPPPPILRGTGHPDLFIANDYGISELYFNDGEAVSRSRQTRPASASRRRAA